MEDLFCEDGEPKAAAVDLAIKAENFEAFAEAARTLKSQGNEAFGARNWLKAAALYAIMRTESFSERWSERT